MAYPFKQMTTQELRERLWDKCKRKAKPEASPANDQKAKTQENICKN